MYSFIEKESRKGLIICFILAFLFTTCYAQDAIRPLRITEKIEPNGILDELAWDIAPVISKFTMIDPTPGGKPSYTTEVKLLYNDAYFFVGIKLYDPEPKKVIATAMERDSDIENDDNVVILIDSYNDNLNGIAFATNPLGARQDFEISQNGQGMNLDFNTFWNVATQANEDGWTTEFIIPFSSLRFTEKEEVIMGFKVLRNIIRKNEIVIAPPFDYTIADPYFRLDLAMDIVFKNLHSKKPIYFAPYIVADMQESKYMNAAGDDWESDYSAMSQKNYFKEPALDKLISNVGADFKMGISKNMTLDLSLNTDFAQAEVDDRIINTTRFNVFLPEKRAFFLESEDYFNFNMGPTKLFFSRNIGRQQGLMVPVLCGARLTGQYEGYQIGALNMQTMGIEGEGIAAENFSVFRLKKDLYNNGSYIGGIITNRMSTSDKTVSSQVLGTDYMHRFNNKWFSRAAVSGSVNNSDTISFNQNNMAGHLSLIKLTNRGFSHILTADYLGQNFDPALGFMRFNNLTTFNAGNSYSWITAEHKTIAGYGFESIAMNARNSTTGVAEIYNFNLSPLLRFKNGAAIKITPADFYQDIYDYSWNMNEDILIPGGNYKMWSSSFVIFSPTTKRSKGQISGKSGSYYGGKMNNLIMSGKFNVNRYFQFDLSYEYNHILFPQEYSISKSEALFKSNLVSLNIKFQANSKLSVKTLVQYDDMSNSFGSNLRFRYNPREGTDFFVVINHGLNTMRRPEQLQYPELPLVARQSIIFKFIRTFDFNSK